MIVSMIDNVYKISCSVQNNNKAFRDADRGTLNKLIDILYIGIYI